MVIRMSGSPNSMLMPRTVATPPAKFEEGKNAGWVSVASPVPVHTKLEYHEREEKLWMEKVIFRESLKAEDAYQTRLAKAKASEEMREWKARQQARENREKQEKERKTEERRRVRVLARVDLMTTVVARPCTFVGSPYVCVRACV